MDRFHLRRREEHGVVLRGNQLIFFMVSFWTGNRKWASRAISIFFENDFSYCSVALDTE